MWENTDRNNSECGHISRNASDVLNGKLNCSFGQKDHKTLFRDSLAFYPDTFLHSSKNASSARSLKMCVITFAIESVVGCFAGLWLFVPFNISLL